MRGTRAKLIRRTVAQEIAQLPHGIQRKRVVAQFRRVYRRAKRRWTRGSPWSWERGGGRRRNWYWAQGRRRL